MAENSRQAKAVDDAVEVERFEPEAEVARQRAEQEKADEAAVAAREAEEAQWAQQEAAENQTARLTEQEARQVQAQAGAAEPPKARVTVKKEDPAVAPEKPNSKSVEEDKCNWSGPCCNPEDRKDAAAAPSQHSPTQSTLDCRKRVILRRSWSRISI